jgi:hypothetical protein
MAKLTLNDLTSGYSAPTVVNANNTLVEAAIENTLSRDGTGPNDMGADLDMGLFRIINLGAPVHQTDAVRVVDIEDGTITVSPTVAWDDIITVPVVLSTFADLVDPNADRLVFWDDSAGATVFLTVGAGLSIAGTTISSTVSSVAWAGITGIPAYVTSLALLADPNADRILFWDDSASNIAHLTVGTGLNITTTSLTFSHLGIESLVDPNADRIMFWDDSGNTTAYLTASTGLLITGTSLTVDATTVQVTFANVTAQPIYVSTLAALADPNDDRILFWDDSAGGVANLDIGASGNLVITTTSIDFASVTGSFTGTLTGVVSGSGTIKYSKNGNVVTLEVPAEIAGVSNSTAHTITGAPAAIFPTTQQRVLAVVVENDTETLALIDIETTGVITLYTGLAQGTFTAADNDGIAKQTFTYHLS